MKKLVLVVAVLACAFAAVAGEKSARSSSDTRVWLPLGLSVITPPIQLPSPSHTVFGGMINLGYGQVENLAVADLGLINNVTDTMTGVELGPINLAGTCVGVQLGVLNFSGSGGAIVFPILNLGF